MPTYISDLGWLADNHPAEFARIPPGLIGNPLYIQRHCTVYPELDGQDDILNGEDAGRWCIVFMAGAALPGAESIPRAEYTIPVVLEIPRPPAEDDDMEMCQFHTLRASRNYCMIHGAGQAGGADGADGPEA